MENQIHESLWKQPANQLCSYKYFWAFANGKCFVAVATQTSELRFLILPQMRGSTWEFDCNPAAIQSDESEARKKVEEWLKRQLGNR